MLIANLAIALILSAGSPNQCDGFPFKRIAEGPPRTEFHGRYVNVPYNYSVVVPRGNTGYDVPDPANHHGFGIAFGRPLRNYLLVSGDHNSLEYEKADEAAKRHVEYLKESGAEILSEKILHSRLGPLKSVRAQVRYRCPVSTQERVLTLVKALSDLQFEYTVQWYSSPDRYKRERVVFDELVRSWKTVSNSNKRRKKFHGPG